MSELEPSMKDFEEELNRSFKKLQEGDKVTGTVIGISDTEVTVDLNCYAEGIIKLEELSNDPRFSIKADVSIGETVTAIVLGEDRDGNLLLSRKKADDLYAWDTLTAMMQSKEIATVKIAQSVNAGVVTYLHGIRAFIPASKLSLNYVEDTSEYVGKTLNVVVAVVDRNNQKLILSAKDVLIEEAAKETSDRISHLEIGQVVNGTVDKIMPFGAFVRLTNGLSGLVHISQICNKRIKSPSEVIKEGEEVSVKILDTKDGKLSLSIKAVEEQEEANEEVQTAPFEYSTGEDAATGLGDLLKKLNL